jgi:hypothetical protein
VQDENSTQECCGIYFLEDVKIRYISFLGEVGMAEKKASEKDEQYDPEVYKRLELVRKQFQRNAAEQKKLEAAERRQLAWLKLRQNKITLGRLILYLVLGAITLAVIGIAVYAWLSR